MASCIAAIRYIAVSQVAVYNAKSEPEGLTDLLNLSHNALDTEDEEID